MRHDLEAALSADLEGSANLVVKPSDLAPEVIGFGLIPAGDPNGPLIRAPDDLDQRPNAGAVTPSTSSRRVSR